MTDLSNIFTQLIADARNGPELGAAIHILASCCYKLENMGYDVCIDGQLIESKDLCSGNYPEYEDLSGSAHFFSLTKNGVPEQYYLVEFPQR